MQAVPASRLEGGTNTTAAITTTHFQDALCYIPKCPTLDASVQILHSLARTGAISADTAERQINTYLLLPAASESKHVSRSGIPLRWFMLPLPDAPHHSLMPDLGYIIHRVLAQDPVPCTLSAVVEQCIPRFRHASPSIPYADSQTHLIGLVNGLLLGLYQGSVKKPRFSIRAGLYANVHTLLTSPPEHQTAFCKANEDIVLLACMEYMARVPPIHMPVQCSALLDGDPTTQGFYRRIPPICDELRQWLDEGETAPSWPAISGACRTKVEHLSRLKRTATAAPTPAPASLSATSTQGGGKKTLLHPPAKQGQHAPLCTAALKACWSTPLLPSGSADEYHLLGLALSLPGDVIQQVQKETRVFSLPGNLRRMQEESLASTGRSRMRASFLQTRWYICMQCMVHHKTQHHRTRLRLDTLTHRLVCATCLTEDPVAINMVGRVLQYHHTHYYLCPTCLTIQPYQGQKEQPWTKGNAQRCCCHHQPGDGKKRGGASDPRPPKRKELCCICLEHSLVQTALRVDHLTGEMHEFHYCQRHAPRQDTARMCVNARQMASFAGRQKKRDYY